MRSKDDSDVILLLRDEDRTRNLLKFSKGKILLHRVFLRLPFLSLRPNISYGLMFRIV